MFSDPNDSFRVHQNLQPFHVFEHYKFHVASFV